MFSQRVYNQNENNSLDDRLTELYSHYFNYKEIKFYDMIHKNWIDRKEAIGYKIYKEVRTDSTIMFYIYKGEYNE